MIWTGEHVTIKRAGQELSLLPALSTTPFGKKGNVMASAIVRENAQKSNSGEYRDIAGFPGYRVNSGGWVESCFRTNGQPTGEWRRIRGSQYGLQKQYTMIALQRNPVIRRLVHHLVLEAFVGPRPEGMVACHINDDPADNRLENLRWGTPESNYRDRDRNGGTAKGERNGWARLSDAKILCIRILAKAGYNNTRLGEMFGVGDGAVSGIVSGKTWKHAPGPIRTQSMRGWARRSR